MSVVISSARVLTARREQRRRELFERVDRKLVEIVFDRGP